MLWYNLSPKTGQKVDSVPRNVIFKYEWRHPRDVPPATEQGEATVGIGDKVWGRGVVTEVNSRNYVSIDGFPRHILDIRPVNAIDEEEKPSDNKAPKRSLRERRPPVWTEDYVMN